MKTGKKNTVVIGEAEAWVLEGRGGLSEEFYAIRVKKSIWIAITHKNKC